MVLPQANEPRREEDKMICPKCGKPLERIVLKVGTYWGHSYTLEHVFRSKPICDYSQEIKARKSQTRAWKGEKNEP